MAAPVAMLPTPATSSDPASRGTIPFRQATTERVSQLPSESAVTIAATTTLFDRNIDGSGYMYGIVLRAFATAAANALNVAFAEDAPHNFYDNVTLHDVNGDIVNITGYGLYLANIINGDYRYRDASQSTNLSLFNMVSGSGATGGTFAQVGTVIAPTTPGTVTYTDNGLKLNTTYRYRVFAVRGTKTSAASSEPTASGG